MVALPALILSVMMVIGFSPCPSQRLETVRRDKPVSCEDFQAFLDHAIIEWQELKETRLILIVRLGTGERDRKLNRARLAYVEDYLKRHKVEYVLAEGERVAGFGRFEVYVGGRLAMSIPVKKGSIKLCWGTNY
jgi:hypothetical protein